MQFNGGGTFSVGPFTTIDGNMEVQNLPSGTALNQICNATVYGNLQIHNNGTAVQIGSASPSLCTGNVIVGNLEVHNNTGSTSMFGNTVSGNLDDHNNTAPTQVFGNTVMKDLQCNSNSSIIGGGTRLRRSRVSVQVSKQCAITDRFVSPRDGEATFAI